MEKVSFDGVNKLINVLSGVTEIDVEPDLYSAWKRWVREEGSDNSKYLPAFKTIGGEPTAAGQFSPKYFFLTNGWRLYIDGNIVPTLDVALNLYVEEGGSPFVIVNGAVVSNLRSDIAVVQDEISQNIDYAGIIIYDEVDGVSGTTYPTGTLAQPVNNTVDLKKLMKKLDINKVRLRSDMTVADDFNDVYFESNSNVEIVNPGNRDLDGCFFYRLKLNGKYSASTITARECVLLDMTDVSGIFSDCLVSGIIYLEANKDTIFKDCASLSTSGGNIPEISMNPGNPTRLSLRNWAGEIKIHDCDTTGDTCTIDFSSGKFYQGTGCTNGLISLRGIGSFGTVESTGSTIDTSGLYDTSFVYEGEIVYDEINGLSGDSYPVGTSRYPVNNWADTKSLLNTYSAHQVAIRSNSQLTESLFLVSVKGSGAPVQIDLGSQNVFGVFFELVVVSGSSLGISPIPSVFQNCVLRDVGGVHGVFKDSSFEGQFSPSYLGESSLFNCIAGNANEDVVLNLSDPGPYSINIKEFYGNITISGMTDSNDVVDVLVSAGRIKIGADCVAGNVIVGGVGRVIDDSGGAVTLDTSNLFDPNATTASIGEILGLSQSNFRITGQTYNADGNLISAVVSTYDNAYDAENQINPIHSYNVTAVYDGSGNLINYQSTKVI